ncbi:hypothetical protein MesoLjLc_51660 [Mesorhizobium sp. L-8-10]|nr:hypothetical protein MesoLjLc_51660 [Mesorhizobium sp. L-8-10]
MLEVFAESVDFSAKGNGRPKVDDVDLAASLMDKVISNRGVREKVDGMLERAYLALHTRNSKWTRRRVRAVFNKEARRIDHWEIEEMQAVIEARKRNADYRAETARIAAMDFGPQATGHSSVDSHQGC